MAIGDPDRPQGKAPQLVAAVFRLPDGTVVDTSAVAQCAASDAEIAALGTAGCPEASRVGEGEFQADTGLGPPVDPVSEVTNVFNGREELIEIVTVPGTTAAGGVDRLRVSGSTLTRTRRSPRAGSRTGGRRRGASPSWYPPAAVQQGRPPAPRPPNALLVEPGRPSGRFTFADGVTEDHRHDGLHGDRGRLAIAGCVPRR